MPTVSSNGDGRDGSIEDRFGVGSTVAANGGDGHDNSLESITKHALVDSDESSRQLPEETDYAYASRLLTVELPKALEESPDGHTADFYIQTALEYLDVSDKKAKPLHDGLMTMTGLYLEAKLDKEVAEAAAEAYKAKLDIDSMTGLYSKNAFFRETDRLASQAERNGNDVYLFMIDGDNFKYINDTHGHKFGDDVIKHMSETLKTVVREYDIAARFGGDEYAVALECNSGRVVQKIAKRFNDMLNADGPMMTDDGKNVHITSSIGVSKYDPRLDAENNLKLADRALYGAKQSGRAVAAHHYANRDPLGEKISGRAVSMHYFKI